MEKRDKRGSGDMSGELHIRHIRLESIEPNLRYVVVGEVLDELCLSIRLHGQHEPISVYFAGRSFRIINGEKRWRACRRLGYRTILARIESE